MSKPNAVQFLKLGFLTGALTLSSLAFAAGPVAQIPPPPREKPAPIRIPGPSYPPLKIEAAWKNDGIETATYQVEAICNGGRKVLRVSEDTILVTDPGSDDRGEQLTRTGERRSYQGETLVYASDLNTLTAMIVSKVTGQQLMCGLNF